MRIKGRLQSECEGFENARSPPPTAPTCIFEPPLLWPRMDVPLPLAMPRVIVQHLIPHPFLSWPYAPLPARSPLLTTNFALKRVLATQDHLPSAYKAGQDFIFRGLVVA